VLSSLGASSIKLILWSYSCCSDKSLNFFLLNRCMKGQIYSGRFSEFVRSNSLPISCCLLSYISVTYTLHILNDISWCYILYIFGYLINYIVPKFQFTSGLCLTSQLYPKNIFILFKSVNLYLKWYKLCDFSILGSIYIENFTCYTHRFHLDILVFNQLFINSYVYASRIH